MNTRNLVLFISLLFLLQYTTSWSGVWRDDFESGGLDEWQVHGILAGKWTEEEGECRFDVHTNGISLLHVGENV